MTDKYRNNAQQRVLAVMLRLAGHEVDGLAPGELASAMSIQPSTITRDLANLQIAGLAEKIPGTERWRLAPKLPQIGLSMLGGIEKSQRRLDEINQRYTRDPH